jgi:16S rRNA C967 or C1407 C5-methylase (RsmB/RsmF family)
VSLQAALLANGFARLRPGGVLVYSTCSLARAQNEGVVAAFLAAAPDAALEAVPVVGAGSPGGLPHTVRFTAAKDDTSGLFVARIRKRAAAARGPCCVS